MFGSKRYWHFMIAMLLVLALGAADVGAAVAPGGPQIGALSVTSVQQTGVRLNAQVTSGGSNAQVMFEYISGTGGAFQPAGSIILPPSPQPQTASVSLGGLTCNKVYQFRVTAQNSGGTTGPTNPFSFITSPCTAAPTVSLSSSGTAQAGGMLTLQANATGQGSLTYEYDLDGDGIFDRRGGQSTLAVSYPGLFDGTAMVRVTDATGAHAISTTDIRTTAPHLSVVQNGLPTQVCGDGDNAPEPGERWSVPVRIVNDGRVTTNGGYASFAATDPVQGTTLETHLLAETAAVPVGNLDPGAFVDATISVSLASDAACGASYGLSFTGGVDRAGSSAGQSAPLLSFNVPAQCQVFTACPKSKAIAAPRQGLYYNPSRSGNGLSNFIVPGAGGSQTYFGAWFTANADHSPTWYIVQGSLLGVAVKAPIYRFTRDLNSPTFKVLAAEVGRSVIAMIDDQHMIMTWTLGGKQGAEIMEYLTAGAAPAPNRTGAWYNAGESGWGEVLHQFVAGGVSNTFAVHYIYDDAGQPRWVIGQDTTAALAAGTAHKSYSVHCPGCPWIADWASLPMASGNASVVFNDATSGITSTSLVLPAPLSGTWIRNNLPIQLLTVPQ